jgi:hypothetical protein
MEKLIWFKLFGHRPCFKFLKDGHGKCLLEKRWPRTQRKCESSVQWCIRSASRLNAASMTSIQGWKWRRRRMYRLICSRAMSCLPNNVTCTNRFTSRHCSSFPLIYVAGYAASLFDWYGTSTCFWKAISTRASNALHEVRRCGTQCRSDL